jgi:CheY-like chemotaxis protein
VKDSSPLPRIIIEALNEPIRAHNGVFKMETTQPVLSHGLAATILLVEDEAPIRLLMWHILIKAGYKVLLAIDGVDGLRKLQESAQVDLLLTDLSMPGMNGFELARRAREMSPSIKVLYSTGSRDCFPEFREETRCLIKPFTVDELLSSVRSVLDSTLSPMASPQKARPTDGNSLDNYSCALFPEFLGSPA